MIVDLCYPFQCGLQPDRPVCSLGRGFYLVLWIVSFIYLFSALALISIDVESGLETEIGQRTMSRSLRTDLNTRFIGRLSGFTKGYNPSYIIKIHSLERLSRWKKLFLYKEKHKRNGRLCRDHKKKQNIFKWLPAREGVWFFCCYLEPMLIYIYIYNNIQVINLPTQNLFNQGTYSDDKNIFSLLRHIIAKNVCIFEKEMEKLEWRMLIIVK